MNLSEGNSRDFEELFKKSFEKHFEGLFFYAHTLLRDEERSKDVVQGVFAKWCETKKIPGDVDACKAYLYTAVYRRSLNAIRDNKTKLAHAYQYVNHFATNSNAKNSYNSQDELVLKINAAIERLPDKNKTVFMKSRLEEKTHKEIANEMSISVKTVENHITKSLKFLRKQLQEYLK